MERIGADLAAGLVARGHEVMVITQPVDSALALNRVKSPLSTDDPHWSHLGSVPIHRFPIQDALERRDTHALQKMREEIASIRRSFGADVTHHAFFSGDCLMELQTDDGAPRVTANHQSGFAALPAVTPMVRLLLARSTAVIAVSQSVRRETLGLAPETLGKIHVISNGVRQTQDPGAPPEGDPVVLASGRLVGEKGFHTLLLAFALLLDRQPRARLRIVGDGYARTGLEQLSVRLGIADRVEFTGWVGQQQMEDFVATSHIVAVPSIWAEPFGLTALEASERGRPVIASPVGGLVEVVADGVTGLHAQAGDPYAWAAAFDQLIQDPERARTMGVAGRERAHREFSLERCIDLYESILLDAAT